MTHNLLTVVDFQDRPIGTKNRADISPSDIYRVSALWLTNSRGDVLLAQRKFTKKHDPGKWGPAVAGTVEAQETYESNIRKEVKEEIGLQGVDFAAGPKVFSNGKHKFFCQWFLASVDRPVHDFTVEEDSVEQVAWFPREQLLAELAQHPGKFLPDAPVVWLQLLGVTGL